MLISKISFIGTTPKRQNPPEESVYHSIERKIRTENKIQKDRWWELDGAKKHLEMVWEENHEEER